LEGDRLSQKNKVRERRLILKETDPKYTQEYVAHKIGITIGAYRAIENNFADPKVSTAIKIAKFFKTTVENLFN
jgi:DNA-binding XRE family transcriptional regulator